MGSERLVAALDGVRDFEDVPADMERGPVAREEEGAHMLYLGIQPTVI